MTVFILFIIHYILISLSFYLVFPKANVESSKGLIPGLNFAEANGIIGRPKWRAVLLLVPIINFFVFAGLMVDLVRSFGKFSWVDSFLAVVCPIAVFYPISKSEKYKYLGPNFTNEQAYNDRIIQAREAKDERGLRKLIEANPYKKSGFREWGESIIFAVFAAALIRMFLVEAFVIPTPSMEGSLLVGDYLFVSKAHYGIRPPMTVAMVPLLHNRIPFLNKESYFESPSLPYKRTWALESIDKNDPIVFNWPVGDSVYLTAQRSWTVGQIKRDPSIANRDRSLKKMVANKDFITRPIDKKDHYIKRCVGTAGDSLQIIDRQLYINGQPVENPTHLQYLYVIDFSTPNINLKKLDGWGINDSDIYPDASGKPRLFFLDQEQVEKIKSLDPNAVIKNYPQKAEGIKLFPHKKEISADWTVDNYGPIWIPKKDATIDLSIDNLPFYRRIIQVYENNDLEISGNIIKVNGQATTSYTFKQDYFWAMGDNRHNSEDSRAWGYVPHDHIVGKPVVIWFSTKNGSMGNGINWDRIFKNPNTF